MISIGIHLLQEAAFSGPLLPTKPCQLTEAWHDPGLNQENCHPISYFQTGYYGGDSMSDYNDLMGELLELGLNV